MAELFDYDAETLRTRLKQYRVAAFSLTIVVMLQFAAWIYWAAWYTFRVVANENEIARIQAEKTPERLVRLETENAEVLRKLDAIHASIQKRN